MNPIRKKGLPWRSVEHRIVVLSPREGNVHELNMVASFLWTRADGTKSLDELCRSTSEAFDGSESEMVADIHAFFQELTELKLIDWEAHDNVDLK